MVINNVKIRKNSNSLNFSKSQELTIHIMVYYGIRRHNVGNLSSTLLLTYTVLVSLIIEDTDIKFRVASREEIMRLQ